MRRSTRIYGHVVAAREAVEIEPVALRTIFGDASLTSPAKLPATPVPRELGVGPIAFLKVQFEMEYTDAKDH